jgi:hypothetical protein
LKLSLIDGHLWAMPDAVSPSTSSPKRCHSRAGGNLGRVTPAKAGV